MTTRRSDKLTRRARRVLRGARPGKVARELPLDLLGVLWFATLPVLKHRGLDGGPTPPGFGQHVLERDGLVEALRDLDLLVVRAGDPFKAGPSAHVFPTERVVQVVLAYARRAKGAKP